MRLTRAVCAAGIILFLCDIVTSRAGSPVLNPRTYRSASGAWTVVLDPSHREGRGSAAYRIARDGATTWSGTLPFALCDARVTDDGVTAGYAYSHGLEGFGTVSGRRGPGDLQIVILDSTGKLRLHRRVRRTQSRFLHTVPNPAVVGLLADAENDRMVVRVADPDINRGEERWWVYRLSTGRPVGVLIPKRGMQEAEPATSIIDAQVVRGTPLVLVHWWRFETVGRLGARFTLIDPGGKALWALDLPEDYTISSDEDAQDRLMASIREQGAILSSDDPAQFELRLVADKARVTFAVTGETSAGWNAAEVSRRPYVHPQPAGEARAVVTERKLRYLGSITLRVPGARPRSPIHDVFHASVPGPGRIAYLTRDASGPGALAVVSLRGELVRRVPLPAICPNGSLAGVACAWVGGWRFVVTRSTERIGKMGKAWWVDADRGKVTPIHGFHVSGPEKLASRGDGRFAVLALVRERHSMRHEVHAFDASGRREWSLAGAAGYGPNDGPERLFSPEDIAVAPNGDVVVLDNIAKTMQVFDRGGRYRRTIDLRKAWGREPSYPADIAADRDGFIIWDFADDAPIVRVDRHGRVRVRYLPRFRDGRQVDVGGRPIAGSDGRVWVSDDNSLLRLTDAGVVDRVLGDRPNPVSLHEIAALTIGPTGRLYAREARTHAVHVFDASGRWLHVCRPLPTDFTASSSLFVEGPTVSPSGKVFVWGAGGGGWVVFGPDGKRLAIQRAPRSRNGGVARPVGERVGTRWEGTWDAILRLDDAGRVIRSLERRANHDWLQSRVEVATAPGGVLAALDRDGRAAIDGPRYVSLYTADGAPVNTFRLPPEVPKWPTLAYSGEVVVVGGGGRLVAFAPSGEPRWQFTPRPVQARELRWDPFITDGGRTLVLHSGGPILYRYALPAPETARQDETPRHPD